MRQFDYNKYLKNNPLLKESIDQMDAVKSQAMKILQDLQNELMSMKTSGTIPDGESVIDRALYILDNIDNEEIDDEKEEKSCSSTNNKKKEIKQEFNVCELLVEEAFQLYKRVCEADQSLDDTDIEHFLFLINELNEDDVKSLNIRENRGNQ